MKGPVLNALGHSGCWSRPSLQAPGVHNLIRPPGSVATYERGSVGPGNRTSTFRGICALRFRPTVAHCRDTTRRFYRHRIAVVVAVRFMCCECTGVHVR